jgi:CDP-paratose 2-epimerase
MKKILITGGSGFVGGNLAIKFANLGYEVLCFDNLVRRGSELNLKRFHLNKNIRFIHGDIRNKEDFIGIDFKPDVVLECAAQPTAIDGYKNPYFDLTNNTYGLVNVLEFCRKNDSALIFWSSNKVYCGDLCNSIPIIEDKTRFKWENNNKFSLNGWSNSGFNEELDLNGNKHSIYGISKVAADLICQEWSDAFDIPLIINRFSCLYGTHQFGKVSQGWVTWFIIAKILKLQLKFYGFNGKQVRDYLHIDDVFNLILKQIKNINNHRGSYYNVGGGEFNTTSILEFNNLLDNIFDTNDSIIIDKKRRGDQVIFISDIKKVCKEFNWKPEKDFNVGLDETILWVKDNIESLKLLL